MIRLDDVADDDVIVDALDEGELHELRHPGYLLGYDELLVGNLLERDRGIHFLGEQLTYVLEGRGYVVRGAVEAADLVVTRVARVTLQHDADVRDVAQVLDVAAILADQPPDVFRGDYELVDGAARVLGVALYAASCEVVKWLFGLEVAYEGHM